MQALLCWEDAWWRPIRRAGAVVPAAMGLETWEFESLNIAASEAKLPIMWLHIMEP